MPRQGRGLESLVSLVESALTGANVTVRSPDHINGRYSKELREVDVTLRGKVGSADLLVIFECRDRAGRQGLDWIEQIATKRDDVGAQLAVAVSAEGFTRGAEALASSKGVVLRRFDDLNAVELNALFDVEDVALVVPRVTINRLHLMQRGNGSIAAANVMAKVSIAPTTPTFGLDDAAPLPPWEDVERVLARALYRSDEAMERLPEILPPIGTELRIMENSGCAWLELQAEASLCLDSREDPLPFAILLAEYDYWVQVGRLRVEKWRSYVGDERARAYVGSGEVNFGSTQRADFVMEHPGCDSFRIQVHPD